MWDRQRARAYCSHVTRDDASQAEGSVTVTPGRAASGPSPTLTPRAGRAPGAPGTSSVTVPGTAWTGRPCTGQPPAAPDPASEQPFDVVLERSGLTLTVPPGRTILSVLAEAGIEVHAACVEGVCGTCETFVLAGRPDHRDCLLTEDERAAGKTMLICVSRCLEGPLVLDL